MATARQTSRKFRREKRIERPLAPRHFEPSEHRVGLMFRAFSDRTRLRLLHLLQDGEVCVGDLVAAIGLPQPTISRHLAYLRRAGLVTVRKDGLWAYYSLARAERAFHGKLLACLRDCFGEVPELAKDRGRARRLNVRGGCCPE